MTLANFLCIGTARSGTTFLHNSISGHSQIYVPTLRKEQNFFDANYHLGLPFYEITAFSGVRDEIAIGEVTPNYIYDPACAERVYESLGPDIKLIVCLRNPAERAYSNYLMYFNWLWESETFKKAIELEPQRLKEKTSQHLDYRARSCYASQLVRYLKFYSPEQMFFIEFENELKAAKDKMLAELFDFLGVDQEKIHGSDSDLARNISVVPTVTYFENSQNVSINKPGGEAVTVHVPADSLLILNLLGGLYVPRGLPELPGFPIEIIRHPSRHMRKFVEKRQSHTPPPKLSEEKCKELNNALFKDDILLLEEQTGRSFSSWLH